MAAEMRAASSSPSRANWESSETTLLAPSSAANAPMRG